MSGARTWGIHFYYFFSFKASGSGLVGKVEACLFSHFEGLCTINSAQSDACACGFDCGRSVRLRRWEKHRRYRMTHSTNNALWKHCITQTEIVLQDTEPARNPANSVLKPLGGCCPDLPQGHEEHVKLCLHLCRLYTKSTAILLEERRCWICCLLIVGGASP